jgi:hypothetical protein
MIQEATQEKYSAVICGHCRQPIPVPAIVIRMESMPHPFDAAGEHSERVFNLRCRSCECEHPYRSSQIVEVEGQPKARRGRPHSAYGLRTLARAAGA